MDITITLEQQDWWRFQRYVERELPKQQRNWFDGFWGSMLTWMVLGFVMLWAFNQVSDFHWPSALFALLVFIFIWLLALVNMHKLRRALEPSATGSFCGEHHFTFGQQGITSNGLGYHGHHAWTIVKKIERVQGMILIYLDNAYAFVFPEEKLSDADEFYRQICAYQKQAQAVSADEEKHHA